MIVRSLRWKPIGAYSYFGTLFAGGLTLGVVGVVISRNPAMALWALYAAPFYCAAFFIVAEIIVVAIVLLRRMVLRLRGGWPVFALAIPATLGGIAIGYVFWWCIEFEAPPLWAAAIAAFGSAAAFGWYARRYELIHAQGRPVNR